MRDPHDHEEIVLSHLCCLKHFLKHLPLMGCAEGLDNAMILEEAAKASEKTRVKAIDNTSTYADGILPLARKWARSTHKLLLISLDQTRHCIAIFIVMQLADVIQCIVGSVAAARA